MRGIVVAAMLAIAVPANAGLSLQPHLAQLTTEGFVVAFETDADARATVEIARIADGGEAAFAKAGESRGQRHRIVVRGLLPDERVRYRVIVDGKPVAEGETQTAPREDATTLDFLVYGDTRDNEAVEREIAVDGLNGAPRLAIHTGDLVPIGDDDAAWRRFFEVEQPLLSQVPLSVAIGNHDRLRDAEGGRAERYLALPDHPPDGIYYTFRTGPVRFVILDSDRPSPAQTAWLERALLAAAVERGHPHVFVLMHHPPFSVGAHCGSAMDEADWVTLFERHRPTAVIAGHDHAYERLDRNGVRCFVTGGGGAPLYKQQPTCPAYDQQAARLFRSEHHVLRVRVRGETVEIEVARPSSSPIETVRFARGDMPAAAGPQLADPRRPSGIATPILSTIIVLAIIGVIALVKRRRVA